jgi:hypothetical protein
MFRGKRVYPINIEEVIIMSEKNKIKIESLLRDWAEAKPREDCFLYSTMLYEYAAKGISKDYEDLTDYEERKVTEHLDACPYCYYQYLDTIEILKQKPTEKELAFIREAIKTAEDRMPTVEPLSSRIRELIAGIGDRLSGLAIYPAPQFAFAHRRAGGGEGKGEDRGEKGMEISRAKEEVLSLRLDAGGCQLILMLETPDNLIRLIYPNTETDFVKQDGAVFTIKFSSKKDALLGNYTLRALAIKDYNITPVNLAFDDIEGHKKKTEEILEQVNGQPKENVLGDIFTWQVKE